MWFTNLQFTVSLLIYNAVGVFYIMMEGFCQENSTASLILHERMRFGDENKRHAEFIFTVKKSVTSVDRFTHKAGGNENSGIEFFGTNGCFAVPSIRGRVLQIQVDVR